MSVEQILAPDPHSKPSSTDRSPAPFVHATDDSTEQEFPLGAFPPQLPFNAPA